MTARSVLGAALLLVLARAAAADWVTQWNMMGPGVNTPVDSRTPPLLLRTLEGDAPDRLVLVTGVTSQGVQLSAVHTDDGAVAWKVTVAPPPGAPANAPLVQLTNGLPHSQQANNSLSLLFLQLGTHVVAVDADTGATRWSHATYNASTPKITGYIGPGGPPRVYLTSSFIDSNRPVPVPVTYIQALDPATGALKWANFTPTPPASGLAVADSASLWGVTPAPGLAVFAQGSRIIGLAAEDGRELWRTTVSAGAQTGLASNVSSVVLVQPSEAVPNRPRPMLLLTSSTWDQTRFMTYALNDTLGNPPSVAWQMSGNNNFEGTLRDELYRLGLQVPQPSITDGAFVTWSNRTAFDPKTGRPIYFTYLVGRSLANGGPIWALNMSAAGLSQTPASPPVVNLGVMAATTSEQLFVGNAGKGGVRYIIPEAPYQPQATGGRLGYTPTTSFSSSWSHMAIVRCLGDTSNNGESICVYNGYAAPAPSAAWQQRPWLRAATAAAAVAAAVVLAL